MRNIIRKILIGTGTMLILSALFLCVHNIIESRNAFQQSQVIVSELKKIIPEQPVTSTGILVQPSTDAEDVPVTQEEDIFAPYEENPDELPAPVELDGRYYCGFLTVPALGLELPVADGWSYEALKYSPCRYSGSAESRDLIIAAHNYNSHFGKISALSLGDEMIFTGTDGVQHRYTVDSTEMVDGYDVDSMFRGQQDEWDITIFTCTLSGKSRVTVRGICADTF